MPQIAIILGSTRPNRNGEQVARWVLDIAAERSDAEFELIDLRDYPLPHLDEPDVGFVSYGSVGGARAAEQLRLIAGSLQMADVRQQVALSMITEFENMSVFTPGSYNVGALHALIDQVIGWSAALAPLRQTEAIA
jgi:NAD(P)H-dependent FMN reductase